MILNTVFKNVSAAAMICTIGLSGVVHADEFQSDNSIVFAGIESRESANFAYVGLIHYFNGDISSDGFIVRALASRANYDYKTVLDEDIDGSADSYELLLGYQKIFDRFSARGYIGLDHENHDLSPDNALDENRGADNGVKVQAEFESDFASPNYGSLVTSYSTAKERYWARLRGGREFSGVVLGAEAVSLGDKEYAERRLGLFLSTRNLIPVAVSAAVGHADPDTYRGPSGPYFTLEVSRTF